MALTQGDMVCPGLFRPFFCVYAVRALARPRDFSLSRPFALWLERYPPIAAAWPLALPERCDVFHHPHDGFGNGVGLG